MVAIKNSVAAIAAAVGMMQMAPAPVAIPIEVGAAIAGGVASGVTGGAIAGGTALCLKFCGGGSSKRSKVMVARDLPAGVSQESVDQCKSQIIDQFTSQNKTVQISDIDATTIHINGLPAACMNLATVVTTQSTAQPDGPVPIPMGTDSINYTNLSVDDRKALAQVFGA